ncbi:MAG: hypothetical protein HZB26_18965 [Candidatus Hydrogenedentes bacterium]|nr:hypothetical protein [Candidatus Hydrogenedentota bacterium]
MTAGPWRSIIPTWSGGSTRPGIYFWTAKILNEFATALNKPEDVQRFAGKMTDIAAAFNAKFFDKEKGFYGNGSQYSQIWPLYLGICPEEAHARVLDRLSSEIVETRKGHLATGILGTKYLYQALSDNGKADLAYLVTQQEDYPSYGYMLKNGATTLWELWKLETGRGMNSHNHQMFGSVVDWFYGDVAGIRTLPEPGYSHVTIAPLPDRDRTVTSAEAYVDTVRGRVSSSWRSLANDGGLELKVTVPPNAKANVIVPMKSGDAVTVRPKLPDTAVVAGKPGQFMVGSGTYTFNVTTPPKEAGSGAR